MKKLCTHTGETRLTLRRSGYVCRINSEIISTKTCKWKYKNRIGVDPTVLERYGCGWICMAECRFESVEDQE